MGNVFDLMHLYRPVGLTELKLIEASEWTAFPPRLPEQPIFYPVLTYEYAKLIVKSWNAQEAEAGYAGFITRFDVQAHFIQQYKVETAGSQQLQELWIPAIDLPEFNRHIVGQIKVVGAHYGPKFTGARQTYSALNRDPSPLYLRPDQSLRNEDDYQRWLRKRADGS
ncbi:MAG: ADP-ribosylation/crystallin J1 [Cyanobacteria bacterium J06648_16]